jgi:prepilin-type N-terminal cleavage/methylation domain-containing protein
MASLVARLRVAPRRDDQGLTLIELLITMAIFSVAMVLVTTAVIKVQRYASDTQGSASANGQLSAALADIDKQVRSGNVLYTPANETIPSSCAPFPTGSTNAGTCMRVFTQANGVQRCVQWQLIVDPVNATRSILRSRSWSPTWETDGATTGWVTKARELVRTPSSAPFELQGNAGAASSRYLQVRFEAIDARRKGPAVLTSFLAGRNTNYGYDAGLCSPVPPST